MTSSSSSRLVLAILANVVLAATACTGFGSSDSATPPPETQAPTRAVDAGDAGDTGPKAPPVEGPATSDELTDDLGIFVTTSGNDTASGTHDQPLATIQAGIEKAKAVGKRVYVCAGTFKESLTLADSISIIGGLECANNTWTTGTGRSRVEAPTSPAIRATDIKAATRIEGLDVAAPNATLPSGSSIGLIADHALALVVARSQIGAGNAMRGADGAEGTQLSNGQLTQGHQAPAQALCVTIDGVSTCDRSVASNDWTPTSGGAAGTNTCVGAPNHAGEDGGRGGSGGLYQWVFNPIAGRLLLLAYKGNAATNAPDVRTGGPGADGADGAGGGATGTISADGYTQADGANGIDGAKGFGGAGGNGLKSTDSSALSDSIWRGWGGAGGGAGGCPGLAGTAGKGGGASIAVVLIESPATFDGAELIAGNGGAGGQGTLGSSPTVGGLAGTNAPENASAILSAKPGGRGGAAGISGNGGSGPSLGIAHKGAPPVITGSTKITPGAGGAAIAVRSRTDAVSRLTKTIPATPAGMSKNILAL